MSEVLFSCKIEVTKHGIKKNSKMIAFNRATGRRFIASNHKAKFLENALIHRLTIEKFKARMDTIECDVNAKITFYYPKSVYFAKAGHRSNKVGDLSNLYQNVEDSLQKAGIIKNDALIIGHDGSRLVPVDDTRYFLEIVITKTS